MNKEYLKELYESNKPIFNEWENEINSPEDLENQIIAYITSNMQYDFNVDIDVDRLFNFGKEIELDEPELDM